MPFIDREKKRESDRASKRRCLYGISPDQFNAMLEAQGFSCAICDAPEPGGRGTWKVDHCHTKGAVRGLLGAGRLGGLGYFKDNQNALLKAAEYLKEHDAARNSHIH